MRDLLPHREKSLPATLGSTSREPRWHQINQADYNKISYGDVRIHSQIIRRKKKIELEESMCILAMVPPPTPS